MLGTSKSLFGANANAWKQVSNHVWNFAAAWSSNTLATGLRRSQAVSALSTTTRKMDLVGNVHLALFVSSCATYVVVSYVSVPRTTENFLTSCVSNFRKKLHFKVLPVLVRPIRAPNSLASSSNHPHQIMWLYWSASSYRSVSVRFENRPVCSNIVFLVCIVVVRVGDFRSAPACYKLHARQKHNYINIIYLRARRSQNVI